MEPTRAEESRWLGKLLLFLLVACVAAAIAGRKLPEPLPASAAATEFSAERALEIVREIARAPHPAGTDENARVRSFLAEKLRALEFEVAEQRGTVRGVPLVNLLVRIPGTASTGTLACLAHFDSVPTGPGAGDDAIGTASWLEVLRALSARGWKPVNDVVLLLTDGEEYGLLGALLFVTEHPWMDSVACVVNLEAIGNGGPALLFQLGAGNGACVEAYARSVAAPAGTSLGDAVYRRMPNDTDLTPFLRRGVPGFNFAISCGRAAYHAPHDTPENLDPQSVQHMGESALALAQHLGSADLRALRTEDAVFFDVLGYGLVRYSRAWDWALAAVGAAVVLTWLWRTRAAGALASNALRHLLEVAAIAAAAAALWWTLDAVLAAVTPAQGWVPGNTTSAALAFAALVLLVAGCELALAARRPPDGTARRRAVLGLWAVAGIASLYGLAGASFAIVLPLLFALPGTLAAVPRSGSRVRGAQLAAGFACALLLGLPILHLIFQLFATAKVLAAVMIGAALASAAGLFAPQLEQIRRDAPWAARSLFAASALLLLLSVFVARVLVWRQGALFP